MLNLEKYQGNCTMKIPRKLNIIKINYKFVCFQII